MEAIRKKHERSLDEVVAAQLHLEQTEEQAAALAKELHLAEAELENVRARVALETKRASEYVSPIEQACREIDQAFEHGGGAPEDEATQRQIQVFKAKRDAERQLWAKEMERQRQAAELLRSELGEIEKLCKAKTPALDVEMALGAAAPQGGTQRTAVEAELGEEQPAKKNPAAAATAAVLAKPSAAGDTLGTSTSGSDTAGSDIEEQQKKAREKEATEKKKQALRQKAAEKAKLAGIALQNAEGKPAEHQSRS